MALRNRLLVLATALALVPSFASLPLAGADTSPSLLATAPIDGNSYAAWKVHYAGGTDLEILVTAVATIAPGAGAVAFVGQVVPVEDAGLDAGGIGVIDVFDTAANTVAVSALGLVETGTTTYEGSPYPSIGMWAGMGDHHPEGIPAGDYYVIAMMGQDAEPFTGEFTLVSDDVTVIDSDFGDAFYFRERNYPAAVNVAVDVGDKRYRSIEGGVVEKDITGKLFTMFFHQEFLPAPIWLDETDGFWVEGPGIYSPVDGIAPTMQYSLERCTGLPFEIVGCEQNAIAQGVMDGQNTIIFTAAGADPGHYKFRVDHWNAVSEVHYPWWNPAPIIMLLGADVQLD